MPGIPAKANADSGGNANGIPGRRRTVIGAKRRWHFDCARSVRLRQGKPVRSVAEEERHKRRKGCGERGAPLVPAQRLRDLRALARTTALLAHGIAAHLDAMRVVNQAVED